MIVQVHREKASNAYFWYCHWIEEKKNNNGWTYVYLSNDISTSSQGDCLGFKKSVYATNNIVKQENFGKYLSNNINSAISNYRKKGSSVQSILNQD